MDKRRKHIIDTNFTDLPFKSKSKGILPILNLTAIWSHPTISYGGAVTVTVIAFPDAGILVTATSDAVPLPEYSALFGVPALSKVS